MDEKWYYGFRFCYPLGKNFFGRPGTTAAKTHELPLPTTYKMSNTLNNSELQPLTVLVTTPCVYNTMTYTEFIHDKRRF